MYMNLVTRLKFIVNELSPIDRVNMYSCVYYPYHSSVVQVLRLLPHLGISQHHPACLAGACRVQVRYYHWPCALSSTFFARFQMYRVSSFAGTRRMTFISLFHHHRVAVNPG